MRTLGTLFELTDLMAVTYEGDKGLESFINNWDHVIAGMSTDPGENTLEQLFLKQMRNSSAMKVEIEHYDRMGKGHPDHSFDFLYKAVARIIERRRKAKNRET